MFLDIVINHNRNIDLNHLKCELKKLHSHFKVFFFTNENKYLKNLKSQKFKLLQKIDLVSLILLKNDHPP